MSRTVAAMAAQRAGLYAGWELVFRLPTTAADLPAGRQVENIKLNLRTKVESCLSSPSHSLYLQIGDVIMSSPTCIKPNVTSSTLSEVSSDYCLKSAWGILKRNVQLIFIVPQVCVNKLLCRLFCCFKNI
jgi:hypothetical protein